MSEYETKTRAEELTEIYDEAARKLRERVSELEAEVARLREAHKKVRDLCDKRIALCRKAEAPRRGTGKMMSMETQLRAAESRMAFQDVLSALGNVE